MVILITLISCLNIYWQLYFVGYHDYPTASSHNYLQSVVMAVGYSGCTLISIVTGLDYSLTGSAKRP